MINHQFGWKKKDHISFLKIEWFFNSKNWIPFNQEDFIPSLVDSGEGFEKSSIYFHYLLPLRKVWSLRLNKREPPLSMNYLCKMLKVA